MQIHPNQIEGIKSLRTECNLPGAEDTEANLNRVITINWLYRLSGRDNGLYSGLWEEFQRHANPDPEESQPG